LIPVHDTPAGATFQVKVHPRARKNAITGVLGDALKLALTSPPVEGRANEACIEFIAKFLNVPRSSVTIAAGESSRQKLIRVAARVPRRWKGSCACFLAEFYESFHQGATENTEKTRSLSFSLSREGAEITR
jgi:uncharacterized protein (TIGR00251 family)